MGNNTSSTPAKSKEEPVLGQFQRHKSAYPFGSHPNSIWVGASSAHHSGPGNDAQSAEPTVSRRHSQPRPASINTQTQYQLLKAAAGHPDLTLAPHSSARLLSGPRNNAEQTLSRRRPTSVQPPAKPASIKSQAQVSDGKAAKEGSTVIFNSTSHHGSSFKHINKIEIYNSTFTIENHSKADLGRLRPSQKADYKYVLGEHALKREACTAGTRVKILEDITKWANDSSSGIPSVFWLTGQAGSGKTTIAYTIAKRFEENGNSDLQTCLGGNFFCSRQFQETQEQIRILPTIAYQLAHKCTSYADALHAANKFDAVNHDISIQLRDLLVGAWQHSEVGCDPERPLYLIVIDALDEINGNRGPAFLRDLLKAIDEYDLTGFKFLVTSRTDPDFIKLCEPYASKAFCRLQDVPIEEAKSDIKTYLKDKLTKLDGTPELAELVHQADGLFIYAATAVKYLTPHRSITFREQIMMLRNLLSKSYEPSSASDATYLIDALYRKIMFDAFSKFKDEFLACRLRVLYTFLCTAERTSTSVVAALVAEGEDDIARAVAEELHAVLYTQGDCIFWYHASFPDFIFNAARSNFDNFMFSCNESAHHDLLAKSCFHFMKSGLRFNMGEIESSFLFDGDTTEALSEKVNSNISAVLRYSCCHWTHHLPSPQLLNDNNLCSCISEFLQIRVLFWIEAMNLLKSRNQCNPMLQSAREWVLKCGNGYSELARDIGEAANFATYFTGSPAVESTPHLYISSLATWSQDTHLCRNWKRQFSRIPVFTHTKGGINLPLMTVATGAYIKSVAFSWDGMRIVSGSLDTTVRVWDSSTGAELNVLNGHFGDVNSVAFSRDDMRIVSGSADMTVRVWDSSTGAKLNVLEGHFNYVNSVAFSRDGMRIVSASDDKTVRVWDASTGAELNVLKGHSDYVNSVAFLKNNMWIVSGSKDNTVRVWDVSTGAELNMLKGRSNYVTFLAVSDDMQIVSGSYDQTMRVWDGSTGAELNVLKSGLSRVNSVAFSRDDTQIVSGLDNVVRVWNVSTGAELNELRGHTGQVTSVAFSRDGMRIVSGSADRSLRVWDGSTGAVLNILEGHSSHVNSVVFSRDGMRILSGSSDDSMRVWDASTGAELNVLETHSTAVQSVAFSRDGMRIVSGSADNTVRVWDVSTGAELNVLKGHFHYVSSVAFSRDGMRIVSASYDETVRVWDASTGAELNVLKHYSWVNTVALSRDGLRIVSGAGDNTVWVWDVSTGECLYMLNGHTLWVNSVAFSRDDQRIVSGSSDTTVRVWDSSTGAELIVLRGHSDYVLSVAFSRNGLWIVSGSNDNTVRVWDVSTGATLNVLKGHTGAVKSVAFSKDSMRIVSGSDDQSVRVWDVLMGAKRKVLKRHNTSVNFDRNMGGESVAFPSDGSSDLIAPRPPWKLTKANWIISQQKDHLMWVPQAAEVIEPSNTLVISRHGFGSVDFQQSMIGFEWVGCYTP